MSMIDRYKKKGGFVQLLNLIETTGKEKQEKFLKLIADENPAWETEIRKKMLSLDRVLAWPSEYIAEILPRMQAMQLAMIVGGLPPEKAEILSKPMGFKEKRQISDILKEKQPTPAETSSGVMKLFSEIRKMEAEGLLKYDKFDADMVIAEDIEENLGKGYISLSAAAAASSSPSHHKITEGPISTAPPPPGTSDHVLEELTSLRRKVVQLTQENQKLLQDNAQMKAKLEQIKKIA